jgi:hypothetical protein
VRDRKILGNSGGQNPVAFFGYNIHFQMKTRITSAALCAVMSASRRIFISPLGTVTLPLPNIGHAQETWTLDPAFQRTPQRVISEFASGVKILSIWVVGAIFAIPLTLHALSGGKFPLEAPVGAQFVFGFSFAGASQPTGANNLPPGLNSYPDLQVIAGIPTTPGQYLVTFSGGGLGFEIDVDAAPPAGPVIISSTSATGKTGSPFRYEIKTSGGTAAPQLSATDIPPGLILDPSSGVISGVPSQDGDTKVFLSVTDGTTSSNGFLQLTFTSDPAVPVIISSSSASLTPGQAFSYTINAPANSGSSDTTSYSLVFDLPSGLSFDSKTGTISGVYTGLGLRGGGPPDGKDLSGGIITNVQLFATNGHGTGTLPLIFFLAPTGAVNISTRIAVGTGDNVLIGGFIVTGNAPKKLIIRAIGPSLKANGAPLSGALQDPMLELYQPAGLLGSNDNWRDSQENEIIGTGIPPTDEHESAILAYLNPGNYTAIVRGKDNSNGIAVVEVYDLGTASLDTSSSAKLAQISTRGTVLSADNVMIGGFIIKADATKVIVRAIGPELNGIVPGALQDTLLELHDGSGSLIFANDDWRSDQEQQIIDTTVPPKDDRESAIVATLNPGNYTAIVRGKNGTTGVALVEVYGLQ